MLFEELYKYNASDDKETGDHFYVATLMYWLLNNELEIFDDVLNHFQDREQYLVCFGIKRAIDKIEATIEKRFDEAAVQSETEEERVYDAEEYKRVSREIFKDILFEIYECQIKNAEEAKEDSREGDGNQSRNEE